MAADAARTLAPDAPPARTRRRAQGRGLPKRRVAGGVVWIALVAVLLTGIVALNVAVLKLNLRLHPLRGGRPPPPPRKPQPPPQAAPGAVPRTPPAPGH